MQKGQPGPQYPPTSAPYPTSQPQQQPPQYPPASQYPPQSQYPGAYGQQYPGAYSQQPYSQQPYSQQPYSQPYSQAPPPYYSAPPGSQSQAYGTGSYPYPTSTGGPPPQYTQPATGATVVVNNLYDPGARFNAGSSRNVPPPPPGCAPNAAQLASMQGHSVVGTQKQGSMFWGETGGGWTW